MLTDINNNNIIKLTYIYSEKHHRLRRTCKGLGKTDDKFEINRAEFLKDGTLV